MTPDALAGMACLLVALAVTAAVLSLVARR